MNYPSIRMLMALLNLIFDGSMIYILIYLLFQPVSARYIYEFPYMKEGMVILKNK